MSETLLIPGEPVKVALIGTGNRSTKIYSPLFSSLKPWIEITAVCDPVRAHADAMAERLGARAYYDIHQLVKDRPMEAAIVVTPIESHHSFSVYLSTNGIHNMTETTWCSLLVQARQMVDTARAHGVTVRVAENFFRYPIDRFAQVLKASNYLGKISRIFSYNDHTGFHNNSRWIRFAEDHPLWVQSIEHTMETGQFKSTAVRFHESETYRARYYLFPGNLLVTDQAANIKGFLGRQTRPGYNEWHGEFGTLVHRGTTATTAPATYYRDGASFTTERAKLVTESELRYCSPESFQRYGSSPDHISRVVNEYNDRHWLRTYAETPGGTLEYVNLLRPDEPSQHRLLEYGACVMGHLVDFALSIRGLIKSEFDEQDALMSMMMELGAQESALRNGERIDLPLDGDCEIDQIKREKIKKQYGVDPLDVEGMLQISYPKP